MTTTASRKSAIDDSELISAAVAARGDLSPRIARMREQVLRAPREISLVRAREVTKAVKQNPDRPRAIQLALGMKEALRKLPISISDDERIAGAHGEKTKCAVLYPEVKSDFLIAELQNFTERETLRFSITDEEKRELREEILLFWKNKSAFDDMMSRQSEDIHFLVDNIAIVIQNDFNGANHLAHIDYEKVLQKGFEGIIDEAKAAMARIESDDPEREGKKSFYTSVIIASEGVIGLASRYSQLAHASASGATSHERAQELREIAEICERVPAKPARTFQEALQAVWLTFIGIAQLDVGQEIPLGRVDQYLYPYYRSDVEEGGLTRSEALELLEEFYIKFNKVTILGEYAVTKVNDGNTSRYELTLGGVGKDGKDATNAFSYLALEAVNNMRLISPNVAVRLHPDSPEAFVNATTNLMTNGANVMHVFNDEVMVKGATRLGWPIQAARDYVLTGCVEPIPGSTYGSPCSAFINGPKILELFLNGGRPMISVCGDEQDLPSPKCSSFAEFYGKFTDYLRSILEKTMDALDIACEIQKRLLPNPILSALIDGTVENGKDIKSGGARYNLLGIDLLGIGTLADSLAAIRKIVYDERQHNLEEVVEWLKSGFRGYEKERQRLLNHLPKYGNNDPYVDEIAKDIVDFMDEVLKEKRTYRNGSWVLGLHSEAHHVYQGAIVAAMPNGRPEGEMLSAGAGPTPGMDREGPTSSLRSMATIDYTKVYAGASCNMRFNPTLFSNQESVGQFASMLKTYFFRLGGQHLQVTVADTETLRKAQQHPEKYEDLFVRIAGYSARFIDLTKPTQEEVIRRSEMCACG
ncbi:hypothetical protein HZA56_20640 [Candidatus Poribacteria bacterium]|nr:hypothetical protein [Candidatus Poribacteria bacterium]